MKDLTHSYNFITTDFTATSLRFNERNTIFCLSRFFVYYTNCWYLLAKND